MGLNKKPAAETAPAETEETAPVKTEEPAPVKTEEPAPAKAKEAEPAAAKEVKPGVRKFRTKTLLLRDPISGVLFQHDRATLSEVTPWVKSQLGAGTLIEEK